MEECGDTEIYAYAKDVQSAAKNLLAIINDIFYNMFAVAFIMLFVDGETLRNVLVKHFFPKALHDTHSDRQINRQYWTILGISTLPVIMLAVYVFKFVTVFDLTGSVSRGTYWQEIHFWQCWLSQPGAGRV